MKKIYVCSRGEALYRRFLSYGVISIYSSNGTPADILQPDNCLFILPLQFDDVEKNGGGLYTITEKQGQQIWEEIERAEKKELEVLLIHCDAGISRSPGVAAAVSRIYFGDDREWFKAPYIPNTKVYNTLLKLKGLSNDYNDNST